MIKTSCDSSPFQKLAVLFSYFLHDSTNATKSIYESSKELLSLFYTGPLSKGQANRCTTPKGISLYFTLVGGSCLVTYAKVAASLCRYMFACTHACGLLQECNYKKHYMYAYAYNGLMIHQAFTRACLTEPPPAAHTEVHAESHSPQAAGPGMEGQPRTPVNMSCITWCCPTHGRVH